MHSRSVEIFGGRAQGRDSISLHPPVAGHLHSAARDRILVLTRPSLPLAVPRPSLSAPLRFAPLCNTFLQILKDLPGMDEGIYSLTAGVAPDFKVGWGSAGGLLLVRCARCSVHPS